MQLVHPWTFWRNALNNLSNIENVKKMEHRFDPQTAFEKESLLINRWMIQDPFWWITVTSHRLIWSLLWLWRECTVLPWPPCTVCVYTHMLHAYIWSALVHQIARLNLPGVHTSNIAIYIMISMFSFVYLAWFWGWEHR